MKLVAGMLLLILCLTANAEPITQELENASQNSLFAKSYQFFSQGKYNSCIEELKTVEENLKTRGEKNNSVFGLVAYWKAISYNRVQNFPDAMSEFNKALNYNYTPIDIHYEYGQALFAGEKLVEARLQFRESVRKNFKRGVSLYYIAYISKELGEKKLAISFYNSIRKLPVEDQKEVLQASEMQIADIYLEQAEKHPDAFRSVEEYVIPQYKKALEVDRTSSLAPEIEKKVVTLQQKYDLVLFKLRNGRATLIPPYFLRADEEIGYDSNVTFSPQETTISQSKQASLYSKTDVIGRYTFYYRDYISVAPEMRFNYTYYFNRVPEIYKNDNYLIAPALRTAFEHTIWKKPASTLLDYDYTYSARDIHAKHSLDFSGRSNTVMLGERFNYFTSGESVFRLRRRMFQSYNPSSDSTTNSVVYEQLIGLKNAYTILFIGSYDMTRVKDSTFDTNSFTTRADLIMPRFKELFTPSIGIALTSTDPINNRAARGRELLFNPNMRLSKTLGKNFRANFKAEYQKNNSKDTENFAYKKYTAAFDLEYLF